MKTLLIKLVVALAFLAAGFSPVFDVKAQGFEIGLNGATAFPQAGFRENMNRNGWGLDGTIGYKLPDLPVTVGMDLGLLVYGHESRSEPFSPNIPEVTVRVQTSNNIFTGHFFTRLEAGKGNIRPYADGLIGLHHLFTESRVGDDDEEHTIASTTNFEDTAFSAGVGAGVKFRIAEGYSQNDGSRYRWSIDLRSRYLFGGSAEYLKEGTLRDTNGNLIYDTSLSRTDLLTFHIGFTVYIF